MLEYFPSFCHLVLFELFILSEKLKNAEQIFLESKSPKSSSFSSVVGKFGPRKEIESFGFLQSSLLNFLDSSVAVFISSLYPPPSLKYELKSPLVHLSYFLIDERVYFFIHVFERAQNDKHFEFRVFRKELLSYFLVLSVLYFIFCSFLPLGNSLTFDSESSGFLNEFAFIFELLPVKSDPTPFLNEVFVFPKDILH